MTYTEMCFKINELSILLSKCLEESKYLLVYYNLIINNDLRCNVELVSKEITDYLMEIIRTTEIECFLINEINSYIVDTVYNYGEEFFIDSEEYFLFERIIKRINNSLMTKFKNSYYVIMKYNSLIRINGFNNVNYKIIKRENYISDKEYSDYIYALKK